MTVDNGTAIDLTLRFYPGQLEQAAEASAQQLTPLDGAIPASHAWDFAGGIGDWYGRFGADYETSIAVSDDALVVTTDGGSLRGAQVDLPAAIPAGVPVRLSFDCALSGGVTGIEAGLLDGHNGVFSSTPGNYGALGSGHHSLDFISGGTGTIGFLSSDETGGFSLDNVVLETAVPVTSASIDLLAASGGDTGTIPGFLCGIHGALFADDTGRAWFRRDRPGPATFCPADAAFVSDLARILRPRIAIIWAGRTNFTSPLTVKSDVAAMVGCLGHQHYLVLPIMPWITDSDDEAATRDQLNADLAATYGTHFLGVIGPLQVANDGSADDLSDVANGWTPRSLRFDQGHLNDAGYGIVAALVHDAIVALGW